MTPQFEAAANFDDWPPNEHGKPTQAAVFGVLHPDKGKAFELLWSGQFPDLEPAMYWAAKKEVEAVRRGKWMMASRAIWQHDLTPEQVRVAMRRKTEPQLDHALRSYASGGGFDIGAGPLRPIGPDDPVPRYVEVADPADAAGDPLAAFVVPPPPPAAKPAPPRPARRERKRRPRR